MKRFDNVTKREYECLFTEAAYEAFCKDPNYWNEVLIRMKSNYTSFDGTWDKVFLLRKNTEKGSDNLRYHPESYYQCRDSMKRYRG